MFLTLVWSMYQDIQVPLGYIFRNATLLLQALTHRSFVSSSSEGSISHNERLEFLGDAVLGLVISESVAEKFPLSSEGELSKIRAGLISRPALAQAAQRMHVGKWLRLGRGEEGTQGREKPSLLSNALEALIGAVYLDGGLEAARLVIRRILGPEFDKIQKGKVPSIRSDFKTRLQEWAHQQGTNPMYRLVGESGPDHQKIFLVEVLMNGEVWGFGEGKTKKDAEQQAAQQALRRSRSSVE
ncbi:MAG TPA: ribonuclease III [Nitrospirales bacterium]|nr:ribonuclease III [Nitrospirales bacterium]